jgi:hypothetical protein
MSNIFPLLQNSRLRKKSNASEQGSTCFHYGNYAQITIKQFHLLFEHDDNRSNNVQIGQVIATGGSGKTQDLFLRHKSS